MRCNTRQVIINYASSICIYLYRKKKIDVQCNVYHRLLVGDYTLIESFAEMISMDGLLIGPVVSLLVFYFICFFCELFKSNMKLDCKTSTGTEIKFRYRSIYMCGRSIYIYTPCQKESICVSWEPWQGILHASGQALTVMHPAASQVGTIPVKRTMAAPADRRSESCGRAPPHGHEQIKDTTRRPEQR